MSTYFFNVYFVVIVLQMLTYAFLDFLKIKQSRKITFLLFFLSYVLVLPNLYEVPKDNGIFIFCGDAPFQILSTEWLIGIGLLFFAHLTYYYIQKDNTTSTTTTKSTK